MYQIVRCLLLLFLVIWTMSNLTWAKNAPSTEIRVTLLGQPCSLQGPYDGEVLKTIHSVGPAQLYPNLSPPDLPGASDQARKAIEKIKKNTQLPPALDRYREKLILRLQAQSVFLEGLKEKNPFISLQKISKDYLRELDYKKFETQLRKLDGLKKDSPAYHDLAELLFDIYNDGIEPDPESEFHRAIKKIGIQYNCSFEESEESSPKAQGSEAPKTPKAPTANDMETPVSPHEGSEGSSPKESK